MEITQQAGKESQESNIIFDYEEQEITVYSNKASVMRRLLKKGFKPNEIKYAGEKIYSLEFRIPMAKASSVMLTTIFKAK